MAALLASISYPALAQDASSEIPQPESSEPSQATGVEALPERISSIPGIQFKGDFEGTDYWYVPDEDFIIAHDKATGFVSIGYLFDKEGNEISSQLTGLEPLTLDDLLPPVSGEATAPPEGAEDLPSLVPQPELIENDSALLENAPEEVRNELLARLVERLTATKTQNEYIKVLDAWREEVRNELGAQPAPNTPDDIRKIMEEAGVNADDLPTSIFEGGAAESSSIGEGAVESALPEDAQEAPPAEQSSENPFVNETPVIEPNPINALMGAETAGPAETAATITMAAEEAMFSKIADESRWFAIGAPGAKTVYMVIDPTCPFCSKALVDLEDDVRNGEIELRVVMAGLLSTKSIETIAGLMLAENPGVALFENAKARINQGGQAVTPRNEADLPEDVINDLNVNRLNVFDLGLSEIPFFIWKTEEGIKMDSGVPSEGDFDDAVPAEQ